MLGGVLALLRYLVPLTLGFLLFAFGLGVSKAKDGNHTCFGHVVFQ